MSNSAGAAATSNETGHAISGGYTPTTTTSGGGGGTTQTPTAMPVFDLSDQELGSHGPGSYTIGIDGAPGAETGYTLQKVVETGTAGVYESSGQPIQITTADGADVNAAKSILADMTHSVGTYTPTTSSSGDGHDEENSGMPVFDLSSDTLGTHDSGLYTIGINGPQDAPTGFTLFPVSYTHLTLPTNREV